MLRRAFQKIKSLPVYFMGVFMPLLLLPSGVTLDPLEVTNGDYMKFTQATGHALPEYWVDGRYPEGQDSEPVVLVTWYDANQYCKWAGGKRTSTEVPTEEGNFKALCGPMDTCDCSHRYLPEWRNMVKGFRCIGGSLQVTTIGNPSRGQP